MEKLTKEILKKEADAFQKDWWDNFLYETENLTKTRVFKNCLTKEETALMRKQILGIISDLAKLRTNRYGYRIYIDGKIVDEKGMEEIYDSPPNEDESLESWVQRSFGDKKFGMIINEGERFNLELSKMIALKVAPLLEKVGFPQEGINFSLFVGNYGWTPLGIHQDSAGESVTHFHFGPGPKTMYTWGDKEFRELVDVRTFNRKDIEPLLPHATKFEFGEGDLYYMPTGEYHVGYSEDLSLSVTFWTYNHTKFRFARRLHSMIADQFLKETRDLVIPDKRELTDSSSVNNVLSCFEFDDDLEKLTYQDLFTEMYTDLRYSIHSNAGYRTSPFPKLEEDSKISENDIILIETPYRIKYRPSHNGEKLYVYVRGHKFSLNNFECICIMIDKINEEERIIVKDLLSLLDSNWPVDVGFYILTMLNQHRGISVIK